MKRSPSFQQDIDEAIKGEFGWWFAAVFEAFEFLGGFGYRLGGVSSHFRGSEVNYTGDTYQVRIRYDPEFHLVQGALVDLRTRVRGVDAREDATAIWVLLRERAPEIEWRQAGMPVDQAGAVETIRQMAAGLRRYGTDLLEGGPMHLASG